MYNALARKSPKNCAQSVTGTTRAVAPAHAAITVSAAGRIRRARRAQNPRSETRPVSRSSRIRSVVMRNPEMTKNTSTPTKPPGTASGHRCHPTTSATATARSAWISGRMPRRSGKASASAVSIRRSARTGAGTATSARRSAVTSIVLFLSGEQGSRQERVERPKSRAPRSAPSFDGGRASVATVPAYPSFVDGLPQTKAALEFAASRHAGQVRDADHAPFILHPLEVAHLLHGRDYPDHVIAAGVL